MKGNLGIYVRRILPRGLVAEEGSLKEGNYCGGEGGGGSGQHSIKGNL